MHTTNTAAAILDRFLGHSELFRWRLDWRDDDTRSKAGVNQGLYVSHNSASFPAPVTLGSLLGIGQFYFIANTVALRGFRFVGNIFADLCQVEGLEQVLLV